MTRSVVDFISSAHRHIKDGELLEKNGCIENAGQLYGYVAECGIKALFILNGGYPVDSEGSPHGHKVHKKHHLRKHIDGILPSIEFINTQICGRVSSKYLDMLGNINCFSDWSVDYRYYDKSSIPSSLSYWKSGAKEIMVMLEKAHLDGVLTKVTL